MLSFEFDCDRPEKFTGRVRDRHLHGVSFVDMASGRHAAYRDHRTIRDADAGFYVLTLQLAGIWMAEFNFETSLPSPGYQELVSQARAHHDEPLLELLGLGGVNPASARY